MIVWLASYPRSGNSLARLLLRTYFQARWGSIYPSAESPGVSILREFLGEPPGLDLADAYSHPEPFFLKTHELPTDDFPAIYIVRDGRDALVSYAHFIVAPERAGHSQPARKDFHEILEQLIVTDDYFGGWGAHLRAWTHRSAPTAIVRYEDLLRDGAVALEGAFRHLGIEIPRKQGEVFPSFQQLHSRFSWFFRKGKIGSWRDDMGPWLERAFWQRHGDLMSRFGYPAGGASPSPSNQRTRAELFLSPHYTRYNEARLNHLAGLGLPMEDATVLDVGAGPGPMTGFFLDRGCRVYSIDARPECVLMLKAAYPQVRIACVNMNQPHPLAAFDRFDIVQCYGLLYHLERPAEAIEAMAAVCSRMLLVESCVSLGEVPACPMVKEDQGDYTQSVTAHGCRPTRAWLYEQLHRHFPFVYLPRIPPCFPDFPEDWTAVTPDQPFTRVVVIASRTRLEQSTLNLIEHPERRTVHLHELPCSV